ncbi:MAG: diaminopimelate decarboxylase [Elusimicrobia bacterium]|nr:diaminopimelate decarboxylase [Elusimicrobiota bacterium]
MITFNYTGGLLHCEGVPVREITKRTGTPVYIYSKNKILKNLAEYGKAFSSVPHLLCYAVKANTGYAVCKTIFSAGAGAEVASGGELYRVLKAGADPRKIVFSGAGKTREEIEFAIRNGVLLINAESVEELSLINTLAGRMERAGQTGGAPRRAGGTSRVGQAGGTRQKILVGIRVNPDIDPHTHRHITTGKSENKFGIPLPFAMNVYRGSGQYSNLSVEGVHCHIGSQIVSTKPFVEMCMKLSSLIKKLRSTGIPVKWTDIGGGLGIKYKDESPPSPTELARKILPVLKPLGTKIILEPGRYIVGNAGILVTKVIYRKRGMQKNFLVVDAGMTDLIRPALYDAYHEISPVEKSLAGRRRVDRVQADRVQADRVRVGRMQAGRMQVGRMQVDVVGPICETSDYLGWDRHLPWLPQGALLAVSCAGAYSSSMSSTYNSRPRATEVMVDGAVWKIIREREDYGDLTRGERTG